MSDNHGTPSIGKRIGEFLILALYLTIDALEIWPHSHFWALAAAFLGLFALVLLDGGLSKLTAVSVIAVTFIGCVVVYLATPGIPPPEPWRGWLQPANDPTPPNGCDISPERQKMLESSGRDFPIPEIIVLLGDTGFFASKKFLAGKTTFIPISNSCGPAMVVDRGPNGIRISAQIYDETGKPLGAKSGNGYEINKEEKVVVEHSADLSTLVVHSGATELLYIRYLNPHAMRVRGIFACPQSKQVITIDNEKIHAASDFSHGCSGDNLYGMVFR